MIRLLFLALLMTGCNTFGPVPNFGGDDAGCTDCADTSLTDTNEPDLSGCPATGDECSTSNDCVLLETCECGFCGGGTWTWARLAHDGTTWRAGGGTFELVDAELGILDGLPVRDVTANGEVELEGDARRAWVSIRRDVLLVTAVDAVDLIWAVRHGANIDPSSPVAMNGLVIEEGGGLREVRFEDVFDAGEASAVDAGALTISGLDGYEAHGAFSATGRVGVFTLHESSGDTPVGVAIAVRKAESGQRVTGESIFSWIREAPTPQAAAGRIGWTSEFAVDLVTVPDSFSPGTGEDPDRDGTGSIDVSDELIDIQLDSSDVHLRVDRPEFAVGRETDGSPGLLFSFLPYSK